MNIKLQTKINTINHNGLHYNSKQERNVTQSNCAEKKDSLPDIRANNLPSMGINFKGRNVGQLYEEYNWLINYDHERPIKAFLKMKDTTESMDNFLKAILNTEDRSYQLIDSIAYSGKELMDVTQGLISKIGENSETLLTFIPGNPYRRAYEKYIISRFDNAHTMSEILKIRPDWAEEALMGKYQRLKGNANFKIGKIPCEFPKENNTFQQILDYLEPLRQQGYKQEQKIDDLKIGNRTYKFKSFTEGKSDKNVFCVTVPEGKKFVLKIGSKEHTGLNEPFSLGTLALVDTYLTTNRSINSAPLRFYDKVRDVSVYSFIEHCPIALKDKPSINEVNSKLSDFRKLGLQYNDTVGSKNYFRLEDVHKEVLSEQELREGIAKEEWISVDNDHVTYDSRLHPPIKGLHRRLPNGMMFCC